jgi:hypothetical protein
MHRRFTEPTLAPLAAGKARSHMLSVARCCWLQASSATWCATSSRARTARGRVTLPPPSAARPTSMRAPRPTPPTGKTPAAATAVVACCSYSSIEAYCSCRSKARPAGRGVGINCESGPWAWAVRAALQGGASHAAPVPRVFHASVRTGVSISISISTRGVRAGGATTAAGSGAATAALRRRSTSCARTTASRWLTWWVPCFLSSSFFSSFLFFSCPSRWLTWWVPCLQGKAAGTTRNMGADRQHGRCVQL